MKTFGKWSISLIWIIPIIILILGLGFLGIHYQGYYWNSNGLPTNQADIILFDGTGYQLIAELGLGKVMSLTTSGTFIWGYTNFIEVNSQSYDLLTWLSQPGNVVNGVIQWPTDYELAIGTNFAEVTGGILTALLVAIPILLIIAIFVTVKMVKAMNRPYSIEYIDARKNLKKTNKKMKKAIKWMKKAVKKNQKTTADLTKEKNSWTKLLTQAKDNFAKEKELFKNMYKKTSKEKEISKNLVS